jgi:hypothetical protein
MDYSTIQKDFAGPLKNIFAQAVQKSATVCGMEKDDQYYEGLLAFARESCGSYKALAKVLGAPSGPAVEAWVRNGVAHKWRFVFGSRFRKSRLALPESSPGQP